MNARPARLPDVVNTTGTSPDAPSTDLVVASNVVPMFERLASDPNASVEKIERLMALWERMEARKAENAFNAAMASAQQQMRPVAADADNPQTRSRYASYKALDKALRPIYTDHGFGLSFDSGESQPDAVRVLCYVTHKTGHARTYHVDLPADGKGAKGGDVMTKTHAVGSAMTYGMRYLLKMIFNVAIGEDDDDGNRAGRREPPPSQSVTAPAGFGDWWTDMQAAGDEGTTALTNAWNASKREHRAHLIATNKAGWEQLKLRAAGVKA